MDSAKLPITFHIYSGDKLIRTETLTQAVIKVGKLSSSHLRVDDDLVSRMHAVIEVSGPDDITIIDLNSSKGTFVNGQKVNKARIQNKDELVLGNTRIVVQVGGESAATSQTLAAQAPPGSAAAPVPAAAAISHPPAAPSRPAPDAVPPAGVATTVPAPRGLATPSTPPPGYGQPAGQASPVAAPPGFGGASGGAVAPPPAASPMAPPPSFGSQMPSSVDDPSSRAVEVAAMFGDSVVEVKHLTNPHVGKTSGMTKGLLIAAALAFALAMVAFAQGVSLAAKNKADFHAWVEVERKSAIDFRPARLAPIWDVLGIGGAFVGLFCVTWGFVRLFDERRSPYFRIGRSKEVEFPTEAVPVDSFALVGPQGDDFVFSWTDGMTGEVTTGGEVKPLDQMPRTMPITQGTNIRVTAGRNTFLVSGVAAPHRTGASALANLDGSYLGILGGTGVIMLFLVVLMSMIPPDATSLAIDVLGNNERLNKVNLKPEEDPKQLEDLTKDTGADAKSGGTGTKQADAEGKMGKKESDRAAGQYAMKDAGVDPQLAKQQQIEEAQNTGVLGILNQRQGGAFAALTGTGDFSSGLDDRDVFGGLVGNEVGEMAGGYGYGVRGYGPGGGGTGLGTVGLGNYGTIGHGSGTGSGYGVGSGKGGMRGRTAKVPQVSIGNATSTGDLDKNIIRRYIRQQLPRIQHCYEKQLVVNPNLAGTVSTQFVISGTGAVISAKASGIGDGTVESCVAGIIRGIQFPKPTGGGIVNVTYPFTFRASGG